MVRYLFRNEDSVGSIPITGSICSSPILWYCSFRRMKPSVVELLIVCVVVGLLASLFGGAVINGEFTELALTLRQLDS